jgi:hypothetical protein
MKKTSRERLPLGIEIRVCAAQSPALKGTERMRAVEAQIEVEEVDTPAAVAGVSPINEAPK